MSSNYELNYWKHKVIKEPRKILGSETHVSTSIHNTNKINEFLKKYANNRSYGIAQEDEYGIYVDSYNTYKKRSDILNVIDHDDIIRLKTSDDFNFSAKEGTLHNYRKTISQIDEQLAATRNELSNVKDQLISAKEKIDTLNGTVEFKKEEQMASIFARLDKAENDLKTFNENIVDNNNAFVSYLNQSAGASTTAQVIMEQTTEFDTLENNKIPLSKEETKTFILKEEKEIKVNSDYNYKYDENSILREQKEEFTHEFSEVHL